jgi:hypothetical protein
MSAGLERHYARLLRLYPADYRRARGTELLETLLASAEDGRRRPAGREVAALVLGALRVRAGRERRQSVRHSWLAAVRAAALMLLVYGTATTAVRMALGLPKVLTLVVAVLLGLFAVIAALGNYYRSAAAIAAAAFLVSVTTSGPNFGDFWQFPLAVVLLLALPRRRPLPVAGLLRYVPALPLLLIAADNGLGQAFPQVAGILQRGVLVALCAGALLWLAVDERVAMALGLLLLNDLLIQLGWTLLDGSAVQSWPAAVSSMAVAAFGPAVLLLTSATAARHQANL